MLIFGGAFLSSSNNSIGLVAAHYSRLEFESCRLLPGTPSQFNRKHARFFSTRKLCGGFHFQVFKTSKILIANSSFKNPLLVFSFSRCSTRWWQLKYFLEFSPPNLGEMIQFDGSHIFQMGWWFNHQLVISVVPSPSLTEVFTFADNRTEAKKPRVEPTG